MKPRELTVPEKHQLKIARDTLKMSDVGARIMGGMTKEEAREVIKRLTGKEPKEESVKEGMSKAQVFMNLMEESDLRGPQPSRQSSDDKPKAVTAIYDNGGKTVDRYSILLSLKEFPDISRPGLVQGFGMSTNPDHPQGFSQWGEFRAGSHLGKRVKWSSLPDNVRKHIIWRLRDE